MKFVRCIFFSVCLFFCLLLFVLIILRDCGGVVVIFCCPGRRLYYIIGGYFVIFMCKIAPRSFFKTSPTQRLNSANQYPFVCLTGYLCLSKAMIASALPTRYSKVRRAESRGVDERSWSSRVDCTNSYVESVVVLFALCSCLVWCRLRFVVVLVLCLMPSLEVAFPCIVVTKRIR